ncbi:Hint domain-containing protein [Oceaniovalibus sp. ACAM 378]|uniref:Hint domain-containing protein n=1 Tax=Oceaniovalibus sp. ACAM 378 TaxID=2599923 RepID=UPI0011D91CD1|nr:Hint domain-containing protein [Oceaniovalibus sp. ACAM 378]TYB87712.1 Hint domain-containing protein [Oceaniovalibus sp. ACAM 378]
MTYEGSFGLEPAQMLPVFDGCDFCAIDGANLGDSLSFADELNLGDVYMLAPRARRERVSVATGHDLRRLSVASDTDHGRVGAALHLDSCLTFMSPNGTTVEALILVELAPDDVSAAAVYLFPLAKLKPKLGYALVAVDRDAAVARFAEAACVSFTRGTHITLASGLQVPIEQLAPGATVLTRDHGPQKLRWIGQQTVRAMGAFAPIRIAAGVLNNDRDLIVSPNHRLFIYQRRERPVTGRAEVLVKAKYLLNGDTVTRTDGGFVDYFQLLFDRHEIIYAEGIAAESLMIDTRTRPALPENVRALLHDTVGNHDTGIDVLRPAPGTTLSAEALRRASSS